MSKDNGLDDKLNELAEIRTNNKIDDVSNINRPETNIENMIYEIRGVQVMLDADVAKVYHSETKIINQTIKRNINRFPDSFCFKLNHDEVARLSLRSQNVTLNESNNFRGRHTKYLPYALTEQGIMMLSGLLKNSLAAHINVEIIDAFVSMRKYISSSLIEQRYINNMAIKDHENIRLLQESFSKLESKQHLSSIFFEGQIFDAYIFLLDLLSKAKEEIIIIDNYAEKELFRIIKDIKVKVIIISKDIEPELIKKYQRQYTNLELRINNSFHDRFIIIDRKVLYHSGASFKDLGKKCFAINLIEDHTILEKLLSEINI